MNKSMHHTVSPVEADARVTVFECGAETWVHVSSSEVVDLPTVLALLAPEVRAGLAGAPSYRPALSLTEHEQELGHWLCDDWVFGVATSDDEREG